MYQKRTPPIKQALRLVNKFTDFYKSTIILKAQIFISRYFEPYFQQKLIF